MFISDDLRNFNSLAFSWLKNGIYALAIAGIYSIILVVLRTPQISHLITNKDLFKSALIVHVNLSVLVWLMSITALFWSYGVKNFIFDNVFSRLAFAGLVLMSLGPFVGNATPIMNNYVPMLENFSFIIGLSLFGVTTLFFALTTFIVSLFDIRSRSKEVATLGIFKLTSSLMYVCVWGCFLLSYSELEQVKQIVPIDIDFYYELLYWSGGHLLQFIYTQSLMMALLLLFESCLSIKLRFTDIYKMFFIINFLLAIIVFYGHISFEIIDGAFKEFYTRHMIHTGGIIPTLFVVTVIYDYLSSTSKVTNPVSIGVILSSMLLFGSGGLIGVYISGINVTIPAHYHGSVVGISVAFMGIAYLYCYSNHIRQNAAHDGFVSIIIGNKITNDVNKSTASSELIEKHTSNNKAAIYQLSVFTVGQILHISGLALAGGYGVMRKSPDGEIPLSAKLYMGMVGGGGLLAIIGGLMFVWICVKKLKSI